MSPEIHVFYLFCIAHVLPIVMPEVLHPCAKQETLMTITRHVEVPVGNEMKNLQCSSRLRIPKCEGICPSQASPSGNNVVTYWVVNKLNESNVFTAAKYF